MCVVCCSLKRASRISSKAFFVKISRPRLDVVNESKMPPTNVAKNFVRWKLKLAVLLITDTFQRRRLVANRSSARNSSLHYCMLHEWLCAITVSNYDRTILRWIMIVLTDNKKKEKRSRTSVCSQQWLRHGGVVALMILACGGGNPEWLSAITLTAFFSARSAVRTPPAVECECSQKLKSRFGSRRMQTRFKKSSYVIERSGQFSRFFFRCVNRRWQLQQQQHCIM